MKKQMMMILVMLTCTITISGVVSAADPYDIGVNVTQQAMTNTNLGLNTSESNLLITTASTAHLNGQTTEDSVQGVVDTTNTLPKNSQKITYGQGNLLVLNDPNGPLEFTFVSKSTNQALRAQKYTVDSTGTINFGDVVYILADPNMSQEAWNYAIQQLGNNAYDIMAIANLWAQGAPADLLATTYSTKTIGQGNMINYAIVKQFQQNYPVSTGKCNYIFSSAGGYNDEAVLQGEFGFSYELYLLNGGDPSKLGIMQYDSNTKTGLFALMKMNDLRSTYGTVVSGTLSELLFNNWLYYNYLKANRLDQLYNVLMLKNIGESNYNYLWYDPITGSGHGLDEAYIAKLGNFAGTFDQSKTVIPITDINTMNQIGKNSFTLASTDPAYLANLGYTGTLVEMQTAFMKDLVNGKIGVIATPYYQNFNGVSLVGLLDGINQDNVFNIHTLMTDTHPWNHAQGYLGILFFRLVNVDPINSANTVINKLMIKVEPDGFGGFTYTNGTSGPGYINTMPLMFAQKAPWNFLRVFMKVGCPRCLQEDLDAAKFGLGKYPLQQFEQYILMSIPVTAASSSEENWSKNAAVRMGLFGVSPSLGTYLSSGGPMTTTNQPTQYPEYILIKWNYMTSTGIAALIQYDLSAMNVLMAADGYSNGGNWHLDKVYPDTGNSYLNAMFSVVREIPLTQDSYEALTAVGGDPVDFLLNYVVPVTPTPITPTPSTPGTSGNGFSTINGALANVWNSLESSSTSTNEITPGLPLEQNIPATTTTTNSSTASLPIATILGTIFLIIAAILVYLGKDIIVATFKRHSRPGK